MDKTRRVRIGAGTLCCALLASAVLVCTLSPKSWGMLAPVQSPSASEGQPSERAADLKAVQAVLESKIVSERLKDLGMSDEEVESRLSRLSDRQVHQLAKDIGALSPGGDVSGILVTIILVLLILILVNRL